LEEKDKKIDINSLQEAFKLFNEASNTLVISYDTLKKEVEKLKDELKSKNQQIKDYAELLDSILMNSSSGILTISNKGDIILKNSIADNMLNRFKDDLLQRLISYEEKGIYEFELKNRFFKVSTSKFSTEDVEGAIFIFDDITDLKAMEVEKSRNDKLKIMGEMAANIAHEIRNPLGSIELFASLLQRDLKDDESKRKLTISILKGVKTINAAISNILLFTKDFKVKKEITCVADIVDDVVLYLVHLMREKQIKFINKVNESDTIYCDQELLKQCLMNLVHNSIEAVDTGGEITIAFLSDDKNSIIEVSDNGEGIHEEFIDRLFIPFQTTKAKGTGLGLSIVYKIVKAHEGNIIADSKKGEYTKFKILIPKKTK
jgi:two-component system sensor histidine kinase FlrB